MPWHDFDPAVVLYLFPGFRDPGSPGPAHRPHRLPDVGHHRSPKETHRSFSSDRLRLRVLGRGRLRLRSAIEHSLGRPDVAHIATSSAVREMLEQMGDRGGHGAARYRRSFPYCRAAAGATTQHRVCLSARASQGDTRPGRRAQALPCDAFLCRSAVLVLPTTLTCPMGRTAGLPYGRSAGQVLQRLCHLRAPEPL